MDQLFFEVIEQLRGGLPYELLHKRLMDVVEGVKESNKEGSITITLKITPAVEGNADQVTVTDEIKSVRPKITGKDTKVDTGKSLFFTTVGNKLQRMDPRQKNIDFATGEIKRIAEEVKTL